MDDYPRQPPLAARIHTQRIIGWQAADGVPLAYILQEECSDPAGRPFTQWVRYPWSLTRHVTAMCTDEFHPLDHTRDEPSYYPLPVSMTPDEANRIIRHAVNRERARRGLPELD